jgi:dTDP-glucose 4,6-dehydratase
VKLFVTGGAGFIGSNFIRWVLRNHSDVSVTNYDLLTYAGNPANLSDLEGDRRYDFVEGDICDADRVAEHLQDHDAVLNFAAATHVDRSIEEASEFVRTNVAGAQALFDAAMRLDIARFLHVSTDEVYGSVEPPREAGEDDALRPGNPYAASKASADLLARAYLKTHGYPITIVRPSNNYGPHQFPEKIVPLFITNLIEGRKVPVYGDGSNVRDWMYVIDTVGALWLVLIEGSSDGIYNVGTGERRTNLGLAEAIVGRMRDPATGGSTIEFVADRPGHDLRYAIDSARVRALGWEPEIEFEEGLDRTIDWYRSNEAWWRPLQQVGAGERRGLRPASDPSLERKDAAPRRAL